MLAYEAPLTNAEGAYVQNSILVNEASYVSTRTLYSSSLCSHKWSFMNARARPECKFSFAHEHKRPTLTCKAPFVKVEGACVHRSHQWSCACMHMLLTHPCTRPSSQGGKVWDFWATPYSRSGSTGAKKRGLPKPQRRPCLAFSKLYTAFSQCYGRLLRPSEAWQEGSQDLENNAYGLKKAWSSQQLPCIGSNWVQLSSSRKRRQQKLTEEVEWLGLG